MNYRFYITVGSSRVECFPQNFLKTSLVDQKEDGKVYYRRKFSGTLRFYCNTKIGTSDFDLLYYTEELIVSGVLGCQEIILEIEQKDSGANTYHNYWIGYFATSDGEWDLDNSTFDVTPLPYDNYKNFDLNGETEYNIIAPAAGLAEVTTNTYTEDYTHNRWLIEVIEYLVSEIEPAATVTSWFFNNPNNPVTNDVNKYRYLTIAQKSDIKRPNATNPANIAMLSFNEIMDIVRGMYNVYWTFDGTNVRIEHTSFWDSEAGIDLRNQDIARRHNKYSYVKEDMPRFEKFSFMEANDSNFTTHTIMYDEKCTSNENNISEYQNNVTTDLQYIIDSVAATDTATQINDNGWVILANYPSGATYYIYRGLAYENSSSVWNYPNSWSYLLRAFFLHDRVLSDGYINSTLVDFISVRKTRKQPIKAIVCYEDDYEPDDYITTELGETFLGGQKGYVDTATIHPDGHVDFLLLYGEDTNEEVVMPPPPKTISVYFDLTKDPNNIYTYLSEPNIYDTYYWIYWDTTDCQEIMIPAGTVYQVDAEGYTGAGVPEFYIYHPSLTGWTFTYNDNDPVDLCTSPPCPGAPPVPPAVPVAPVATGVTQLNLCSELIFTWGAVGDATFYKVFRKPDADLLDNWEEQGNELDTTFEDYWAGTQSGITFYYKVQACNISGCSADSNEVSKNVAC